MNLFEMPGYEYKAYGLKYKEGDAFIVAANMLAHAGLLLHRWGAFNTDVTQDGEWLIIRGTKNCLNTTVVVASTNIQEMVTDDPIVQPIIDKTSEDNISTVAIEVTEETWKTDERR